MVGRPRDDLAGKVDAVNELGKFNDLVGVLGEICGRHMLAPQDAEQVAVADDHRLQVVLADLTADLFAQGPGQIGGHLVHRHPSLFGSPLPAFPALSGVAHFNRWRR